jgi:hypothetical protein
VGKDGFCGWRQDKRETEPVHSPSVGAFAILTVATLTVRCLEYPPSPRGSVRRPGATIHLHPRDENPDIEKL